MSVTTPPSDSPSALHNPSELVCLWKQCHLKFEDPELLYHHLSNDHVGRKATGNLCLECHWEKCEVKTGKRDHITSHLRVHVPLKPHVCETCNKAFKRRQDLKKHEKIHTEQHQQLISDHKHQRLQKTSHPQTPPQYPRPERSPSVCSSIESQSSFPLSPGRVVPGYGFNTTPPHDNSYDNYDVYPNYENYDMSSPTVIPEFVNYNSVKRPDVSNTYVPASNKRGVDAMDEFYLDVKRKRVEPVYNQAMAERLDALETYIDVADLNSTTLNSFSRADLQNMETFFVQLSGGVLPYIDDAGLTGGLSTPDSTAFDVGLTLGSDMLPSDSVMYPTLGYPSDAVHTPESLHESGDETPIVPSTHIANVTINPNDLNGLMSPPEETHEYVPQGLDETNFNAIYPTMANIVFDPSAPAASSSETIRIMKMPNATVMTDAYMNYDVTDVIQVQCSNTSRSLSQKDITVKTEAKEIITPTPKRGGFTGLDSNDKKSIASPNISDRTNSKFVSVTKIDDKSDVDALSSKIAKLDLGDKKSTKLDAEMRKKHAALIYALYQKIHKLYIEMDEKEKIATNKEETRAIVVE